MSADAFRTAVESKDLDATVACLATAVVFHSPIVFKEYNGRDEVRPILAGVMSVFEDFAYIGDYRAPGGAVLHFTARIGDRTLDGVDILTFDSEGLVGEFTVMIRPYSAATELRARMAALLAQAG
jgi:limonene-1,2-epoxide hydrolase